MQKHINYSKINPNTKEATINQISKMADDMLFDVTLSNI